VAAPQRNPSGNFLSAIAFSSMDCKCVGFIAQLYHN
jgi:hypothetical protein